MSEPRVPDLASPDLERRMEDADLIESDRDEVRTFAEFLRWRAWRRAGGQGPPERWVLDYIEGKS